MHGLIISTQAEAASPVEVAERKGKGHPDTICDGLAENLSRALVKYYIAEFGEIQHHNVDKALLCAGRSSPAFRGGHVLEPIDIYLAGRAVAEGTNGERHIHELAMESACSWLRDNLHALDVDRNVRIQPVLRPGSRDLTRLFRRRSGQAPLANDTSIGVGYAPLSQLERLVLAADARLDRRPRPDQERSWGEDTKIMGLRVGNEVRMTVACAMIGTYLDNLDDYLKQKATIEAIIRDEVDKSGLEAKMVHVNAADRVDAGAIYLTVSGTSAESGDDGQVGRGNRVNGLITPGRPMSLEAAAGKNPVSHVGKIYNVAAHEICSEIIARMPAVARAECLLVSQIGSPITEPALAEVKIATRGGVDAADLAQEIEGIVATALTALPHRLDDFVSGRLPLF